jgi:hypothetical protein
MLNTGPHHRGEITSLLIEVEQEVLDTAERLGLLVLHYDGTRLGRDTVRADISQVFEFFTRRQTEGQFPLVKNEKALEVAAQLDPGHAKVVLAQPWPMLTKLALEALQRRGLLPPASAQRLVAYTGDASEATEGAYRADGTWVLTVVVLTALFRGFGELIQDAVVWTPTASRSRTRQLLRVGGGLQLATSARDAVESLAKEQAAFHATLKRLGHPRSRVLPRGTPYVADTWRLGPPDARANMLMPGAFALGDVPRAVQVLTDHDEPAILAALMTRDGEHTGSLGFKRGKMRWDGFEHSVNAEQLADELLSFSPRVAKDFVQINLRDDHDRAGRFQVPPRVRHLTSRGNLINDGTPDAVLLRQVSAGAETLAFAHNLPPNPRGHDVLVQGVEALLAMRQEPATSACVTRSIMDLGAPYNIRGNTIAAKVGMLGLGAFFRAVMVAAVRDHDRRMGDELTDA